MIIKPVRQIWCDGNHREPTRMVSNDLIRDYMQRHGCNFSDALEALAAQMATHRTGRQTRSAGAEPGRCAVDLLEALEAWRADQMQQAA